MKTHQCNSRCNGHCYDSSSVVSISIMNGVRDAGCEHTAIVTGGGKSCVEIEAFTWVNTVLRNVNKCN